jgi:hypothetical protein
VCLVLLVRSWPLSPESLFGTGWNAKSVIFKLLFVVHLSVHNANENVSLPKL